MANQVVCVTGAAGFIASWLVKLLLARGYTVKATVRNLCEPRKVDHLMALEGADERLHLFEADLLNEGSFDSVIDGCHGVFHTASPVLLSDRVSNPQKELIDPAVNGTLNVLNSCKKSVTLKRVVITSSMASVIVNSNPLNPDVKVDETWFSDTDFCNEKKKWYPLAKMLAEKAAWEFAEANGLDLVTLHPGFVIGPLLQPTINLTSQTFVGFVKEGKTLVPVYGFVDVRDVVLAHILALENPHARGRYCLVARVTRSFEAMDMLNRIFPFLNLPSSAGRNDHGSKSDSPPYQVSKEKAESLGISFRAVEVSFKETVESLEQKGFITF